MPRLPRIVLLSLALAGCASAPSRPPLTPWTTRPLASTSADAASNAAVLAGELALLRGDFETARTAYLAVAERSEDAPTLARAIDVIADTGDAAAARAGVARWVAREPDSVPALRWHAVLALRARELALAHAAFERLYALTDADGVVTLMASERPVARTLQVALPMADAHAGDAALALGVARLAERTSDLGVATRLATRALALRPAWDEAIVLLARAEMRRGGERAALAALERLQAAEPGSAALAVQTASLLAEAGAAAEARAILDRYLARAPGDLDTRYARALLLAQGQDRAFAANEFRALAAAGVRPDEVPYWLGLLAEQDGQEVEALDWYRRVGDAGPLTAAVLRAARIIGRREDLGLARELIAQVRAGRPDLAPGLVTGEAGLLADAGRLAEARALLDAAAIAFPADEDLLQQRAGLALRAGDVATAEQALRSLLATRSDDPILQNALGYTLADAAQKLDEARALLDAALVVAPDEPAILDSAGWVRFRQGDYTGARPLLERAWRLAGDAEIGAHLGELLWMQGERAAAARIWDAARARDPEHAVLHATRARLER